VRLSVLDIRNHRFGRALNGYDRREVESFLQMIGEDYESLTLEADALRQRVRELEGQVNEFSIEERQLREAILSVQSVSEDMKRVALKECETILGDAELRAEKIVESAHRRAATLSEDIREMKLLRARMAAAVRNAVGTHLTLLESLSEDGDERAVEESKVTYLSPSARVLGSGEGA